MSRTQALLAAALCAARHLPTILGGRDHIGASDTIILRTDPSRVTG